MSKDKGSDGKWTVAAWVVGAIVLCIAATWIYNVANGITQ